MYKQETDGCQTNKPLDLLSTDQINEQYNLFRKYCTKLISEELKHGNYDHLRGCNTKGPKKVNPNDITEELVAKYKARLNIMARSLDLEQTGEGTMEVGHLETMVVIRADFRDEKDYKNGFDICYKSDLQFGESEDESRKEIEEEFDLEEQYNTITAIFGESLAYDEIADSAQQELRKQKQMLYCSLCRGNFKEFIKLIMEITDDSIGHFKKKWGYI